MTTTTAPAADALTTRIEQVSDGMLITALTMHEAQLTDAALASADGAALRLVRSRLISEVERRYPTAAVAADAAFGDYDDAIESGEEADEPDYVAVLIAALPV